jgi:hypothetical protein
VPLRVAIFDDVLAARREVFHIPGLEISVHGDADDVLAIAAAATPPHVICMDYAMGAAHVNGEDAIRALRASGFRGRIVAMSSDPAANARMIEAGADEQLAQKAMLRSYLVALGKERGATPLGLVALVAAFSLVVGGAALAAGRYGQRSRWRGGEEKLQARVLPQGAQPSQLDGAPAVVEVVAVWASRTMTDRQGRALVHVAGPAELTPRAAELHVAAGGERLTLVADRATRWHLADGPARRIRTPGDVREGRGLSGPPMSSFVARSRRVLEGQHLVAIGHRDEGRFRAIAIADEERAAALGSDTVPAPARQAQAYALAGVGLVALFLAAIRRGA